MPVPKYKVADIIHSKDDNKYYMVMEVGFDAYTLLDMQLNMPQMWYIDYTDSRHYIKLVA